MRFLIVSFLMASAARVDAAPPRRSSLRREEPRAAIAQPEDFRAGIYPGQSQQDSIPAEASPTPQAEVDRVLGLLPKPDIAFVDFGCGDARWCISAASKWGCRAYGIEIDPERAAMARQRVNEAGLDHLITIVEGDSTKIDVLADVGAGYMYPAILASLRPKIEKLRAYASFMHVVPNLAGMGQNGESWIWQKQQIATRPAAQPMAIWNGVAYSGPVCNAPGCRMCAAIRAAIAQQTR